MIIKWRKSAHSEAHGNCVELAALPNAIAIRDSKDADTGHLTISPHAFATLVHRLKRDGQIR